LAALQDDEQQAAPPQQSHPLPALTIPTLAVASQEHSEQAHASPQQVQDAVATLLTFVPFAALASFPQQALSLASATLVFVAVAVQQAAPPQQSQSLDAPAFVASQVQAEQAQASPQHAHAALAAFVFSAASAPTPITAARAIAPSTPIIRRRSIALPPDSLT